MWSFRGGQVVLLAPRSLVLVLGGPSGPLGTVLELLTAPSRPSEALIGPLGLVI